MLKVKVKPTTFKRKGRLIHRKGYTYTRKDIGAPGRGQKAIPELEKGKMNAVAKKMGYKSVIDIPKNKYPEFAKRLIDAYGERKAWGMAHAQVIFRKRGLPHLNKFKAIRAAIAREIKKTPGWD